MPWRASIRSLALGSGLVMACSLTTDFEGLTERTGSADGGREPATLPGRGSSGTSTNGTTPETDAESGSIESSPDAESGPVVSGTCTMGNQTIQDNGGSCTSTTTYDCDGSQFAIQCLCPAATCFCSKGGTTYRTVSGTCPCRGAGVPEAVVTACGLKAEGSPSF